MSTLSTSNSSEYPMQNNYSKSLHFLDIGTVQRGNCVSKKVFNVSWSKKNSLQEKQCEYSKH